MHRLHFFINQDIMSVNRREQTDFCSRRYPLNKMMQGEAMNRQYPSHPEDILNHSISGFHQYTLTPVPRLTYVSQNLCLMLGLEEEDFNTADDDDAYCARVYPSDRNDYLHFLQSLKEDGQTETLCYRLCRKDGSLLSVSDTICVRAGEDGILTGHSILTDVSDLQSENKELHFLNETIPCGFIKYTCEKHPRITYINRQMLDFLRFPKEDSPENTDMLSLFQENIFFMIPMEERKRFSLYLNRVRSARIPLAGEMTLLRCDGTKAYMFGWVTLSVNEQGEEEFQSICMDLTDRHQEKKAKEAERYLKALSDVYDKIFEYDRETSTVKCLYSSGSPSFQNLENIPMQMQEATEKWIRDTVISEDQEALLAFFEDFYRRKEETDGARPPQIAYHALSSSGETRLYNGIFLRISRYASLFCCRCVPDMQEASLLRTENLSLKENLHDLVLRFTDGIAAFEITDEYVTPLYASDNVCEFFGYSREEWLALMKKSTPIRDFIADSPVSYKDVTSFLHNGEAEFPYFDIHTGSMQNIRAVCSQKSPGGSAPGYVMLYTVPCSVPEEKPISIRTFGYFDVFVGEKPIAFRNKKSKELFALLVDRRGGFVSSEEAISFLWEDEPVSPVTLSRYRKVALRLKNILEEYGISDIVESVDGKRRIAAEKVRCDLYDYLSGKEEYAQLFKGSYLTNYSWSENTLAELTGSMLYSPELP